MACTEQSLTGVSVSKEASVEACRLEPQGPQNPPYVGPHEEPFSWRLFSHLIHPSVWVLIAALWIGVVALIFHEAG
jgi:hypothetical protein